MRFLLCILCIFAWNPLSAQPVLPFLCLNEKSAANLNITRERTFEGPGLYGFMNGGSELFLEYGFQQLLEQRLTFSNVPFSVEYYLMDTPENAYGIYSVHTFKCRRMDERFPVECLIPGLLQLYHGNLYLSLKCMDRTVDAQPLLDSLTALITRQNPGGEGVRLNSFPPPHSGTLYYVCGDLGLSAACIGWAKFFVPYMQYAMWLRVDSDTKKTSAQVVFASDDDALAFCSQNEHFLSIEKRGNVIYIQEK